jgi:hypothetical protein
MGKGSKSKRQMNVLIKRIKRKRELKKASMRTFSRPAEETNGQNVNAQPVNNTAEVKKSAPVAEETAVQDDSATEQPENNEQAAE